MPSQWQVLQLYAINHLLPIRDVNATQDSRVKIFFLDPRKGISQLPRIETSDRLTTFKSKLDIPIFSHIYIQLIYLPPALLKLRPKALYKGAS